MESDSTLPWLVWAFSVVGFALASLGKASLSSVRPERVRWLASQKVRGSGGLESLQAGPLGPTGALSLLRYLFLTSALLSGAAVVIAHWDVHWGLITLSSVAILALLGVAHVATGALASVLGERAALRVAPAVDVLMFVFRPILAAQIYLVQWIRQAGPDQLEALSGELVISINSEGEPLDEREVKMIRGVVQLDKTTAREIMVPRVDIVAADAGTSLEELAEQLVRSGHSRVPVFDGSLDHIEGIAYARDVLAHLNNNEEAPKTLMAGLLRPALFIPESKILEELLTEFQQMQVHIAIVVDEYGGVSGLVTIEDLLEEIVGEIHDEFDIGEAEIEPVNDSEFLMDARVSIDQLKELLHVELEGDGFDTLGGFVYQRLGKIPSSGDKVEYADLRIQVVSTVGRRLKRLRVTRQAADGADTQ